MKFIYPCKCVVCGTDFVSTRGQSRFCSRACLGVSKRGKPNPIQRKGKVKQCLHCGKDFYSKPARVGTSRFCSSYCVGKHNTTGKVSTFDVVCIQCGNEFTYETRSKVPKKWCSRACRTKHRLLNVGNMEGRKRFSSKGLIKQCEKCGYDEEPRILGVHHKDKNRLNNDDSNLAVLCPNCHSLEHLKHIPQIPYAHQER